MILFEQSSFGQWQDFNLGGLKLKSELRKVLQGIAYIIYSSKLLSKHKPVARPVFQRWQIFTREITRNKI